LPLILRATSKLLAHLPTTAAAPPPASTGALGDWYATRIVVDRQPLVVAISQHGYLPIVIRGGEVGTLLDRFPDIVARRLRPFRVDARHIAMEVDAMESIHVAPTVDRAVNGVLTTVAREMPLHRTRGIWNDRTLSQVEAQCSQMPWHASRRSDAVVVPAERVLQLMIQHWGPLPEEEQRRIPFFEEMGWFTPARRFAPSATPPLNFPADLPFVAWLPAAVRDGATNVAVDYTIATDPIDEPEQPEDDADMTGRFADLRLRTDSITSPYGPLGSQWNFDAARAMVTAAVGEVVNEMIGQLESAGWQSEEPSPELSLAGSIPFRHHFRRHTATLWVWGIITALGGGVSCHLDREGKQQ
jgi:hypothetical protein